MSVPSTDLRLYLRGVSEDHNADRHASSPSAHRTKRKKNPKHLFRSSGHQPLPHYKTSTKHQRLNWFQTIARTTSRYRATRALPIKRKRYSRCATAVKKYYWQIRVNLLSYLLTVGSDLYCRENSSNRPRKSCALRMSNAVRQPRYSCYNCNCKPRL